MNLNQEQYIEKRTQQWLESKRQSWLLDQPIAYTPQEHDDWEIERTRILKSSEGKRQKAAFATQWEWMLSAVRFKVEAGTYAGWTVAAQMLIDEREGLPRFEPDGTFSDSGVPMWLCKIDNKLTACEEHEAFKAMADVHAVEVFGPITYWEQPMVEAAAA